MRGPVNYDDYDPVLVDRIVTGQPAPWPVHPADAAEVVRRMARLGYSDGQIAHRLGFSRRAVYRIRRRRGIPAALPAIGANGHTRLHAAPNRPIRAG